MRNEQYLIYVQGVTPESRVEFIVGKGVPVSPRLLATDHSKALILMYFLLCVIWRPGLGVLYRILYCLVRCLLF